MKRLIGIFAASLLVFLSMVPSVLADDVGTQRDGRVLIAIGGDLTVPAGERADVVIVIGGTATIAGDVEAIVAIDGRARLDGARTDTVVAFAAPVELVGGTVVTGDVLTLGSDVSQAAGVRVDGGVRDMWPGIAAMAAMLAPALILLFIGFAVAAIAAALLLAGLAPRQIRAAGELIRHETVLTIGVGLLGLIAPIVLLIALTVTVIGAPLAFGIAFGLWPLAAFLGYLVAGILIGEWIIGKTSPGVVRERPYLAAVVGMLALQVISLVPLVGTIASFLGYGAVLLLAWRILRAGSSATPLTSQPTPALSPG